jgi:hypothetical protein
LNNCDDFQLLATTLESHTVSRIEAPQPFEEALDVYLKRHNDFDSGLSNQMGGLRGARSKMLSDRELFLLVQFYFLISTFPPTATVMANFLKSTGINVLRFPTAPKLVHALDLVLELEHCIFSHSVKIVWLPTASTQLKQL